MKKKIFEELLLLNILAIGFLLAGLFFVILDLTKEEIKSENDLRKITSTLKSYKFEQKEHTSNRTRRNQERDDITTNLEIYLNRYDNTFAVPQDMGYNFVEIFDTISFKYKLDHEDSVTIYIRPSDFSNLNKGKRIEIFGLVGKVNDIYESESEKYVTILNPKESVDDYNFRGSLIFGLFMISGSILIFLFTFFYTQIITFFCLIVSGIVWVFERITEKSDNKSDF